MCEIVTFVVCSILALYTQFLNYILRYKFFAILSKWRSLEKQLIERWVLTENGFKRLMQLKKFTWFSPLMRSLVDGRCFFPRTRHDLFTFHVVQTCQSTMKKTVTRSWCWLYTRRTYHQRDRAILVVGQCVSAGCWGGVVIGDASAHAHVDLHAHASIDRSLRADCNSFALGVPRLD